MPRPEGRGAVDRDRRERRVGGRENGRPALVLAEAELDHDAILLRELADAAVRLAHAAERICLLCEAARLRLLLE